MGTTVRWNVIQQAGTCSKHFDRFSQKSTGTPLCISRVGLCEEILQWCISTRLTTSMKTPGMAVFKQQNVDDFYEIGEELGRQVFSSKQFNEARTLADV